MLYLFTTHSIYRLTCQSTDSSASRVKELQGAGKCSIGWFYSTLHQKDDHHHILISIWWSRIVFFFSKIIENWILGEKLAFWVRALDVYCMVCLELLQRAITSGRILRECVTQCFHLLMPWRHSDYNLNVSRMGKL